MSTGAPPLAARYKGNMVTPLRLLGLVLAIGIVGALCLLSAAGATIVAIATVAAVAIDTSRHRSPRMAEPDHITVDLRDR